jgi:hypothetical protein
MTHRIVIGTSRHQPRSSLPFLQSSSRTGS